MCTFKLIFQSAFSTPLPLKAHKSLLLLSSNYYFATSHFRYCLPIITRQKHENSTRNEFPSVATLSRLLCSDGKDHNNCIEVHDSLMQQRWGQLSYYCLIIQFGFHAGVCHVSHVPVQVYILFVGPLRILHPLDTGRTFGQCPALTGSRFTCTYLEFAVGSLYWCET